MMRPRAVRAFLLALCLLHAPAAAVPVHGGPDFGGDPPRDPFDDARFFWRLLTTEVK